MSEKSNLASVFTNRGFLNLWLNQVLVQLSFNSVNFTLIIWVFQLTNSNTAVSLLLLAINLPAVLLGLFSGVLIDLIDRKKIILFINFCLSLLFFSLIYFKEGVPAILMIAFFINALVQFYAPAEASSIPLVVKRNQLLSANSIFSATLYCCFLLGFGLSGPLINFFDINLIFGLAAIALSLAFILALLFPSIVTNPSKEGLKLISAIKKGEINNIKEVGLSEIIKTLRLIRGKLSVLTSIFILAGVQMVIGVLAVLMPSFLENSIHIKATDSSYVLVLPLGIGIIAGGLILGRVGYKLVKRLLVSKAIILGGLLFSFAGIAPFVVPTVNYFSSQPLPFFTQPSLALILMVGGFFLGLCLVAVMVPTQTVLHENTPDEDRGKVFSVLGVVMSGLTLIPVLLAGVFSDIFGVSPIFIVLGVIIIIIGLLGLKPALFFRKKSLPLKVRQFLGLGHWNER